MMLMSCEAVRHSMFVLVSTLGFLFTHFYDEMLKTLVEDFTLYSHKNRTFPKERLTRIIDENNSTANFTTPPEIEDQVKCQNGYSGLFDYKQALDKVDSKLIYNFSTLEQDPRYECMKVALDSNYSFVVCVNEMADKPRHWDQGQIEHLYSWLAKDKHLAYMDLSGGNGFYALAAASMDHKAIVIESEDMNLNRIYKGIKLSHLEHEVTLLNAQISDSVDIENSNCTSTQCGHKSNQISIDYLANMTSFEKLILRVHLKEDNVINALLYSNILFSKLCIPFIITEIDTGSMTLDSKVAFIQFSNMLIEQKGYRPFTENGIALALNSALEWPTHVYWVAGANLIKQ